MLTCAPAAQCGRPRTQNLTLIINYQPAALRSGGAQRAGADQVGEPGPRHQVGA